ncbi:FAD binding domain-containing protein [Streptomyces sp. NPDC059851]|uniref:FAD binding domain-containing protein n=1 Tax=Streptomyces sp. NPDC059851 TaxID=3346971 RepID=UPI0036469486
MKEFAYVRPADLAGAVEAHGGRPGSAYLAGGTNLVDLMKLGVAEPDTVVDVSRLLDNSVTRTEDGGVRIGAGVRNADLAAHPLVGRCPVVVQALASGASAQIRNMATTGGNLLQRTRCPYFQDTAKPCNKRRPGSGCGALDGITRDHAVLGHSPSCIATHPSDLAVALAALDAEVELLGPADRGNRTVPVGDFIRLPDDRPERDTLLEPGELLTAVLLPAGAFGVPSRYRKVRDRASYAFALVSAAAVLELSDGRVRRVALAFGGLAHRPWRARTAEELLLGEEPAPGVLRTAVEAELGRARPRPDNAFKVELARNLACEVLDGLVSASASARAT